MITSLLNADRNPNTAFRLMLSEFFNYNTFTTLQRAATFEVAIFFRTHGLARVRCPNNHDTNYIRQDVSSILESAEVFFQNRVRNDFT